MPKYSVDELSREIQALFEQAHAGDITPADFCKSLDRHGVPGTRKMLFTRDAFGLPLEKAKEIVIENEHGSLESWGKEIGDLIEGLSADSKRKQK